MARIIDVQIMKSLEPLKKSAPLSNKLFADFDPQALYPIISSRTGQIG